MALPTIDELKAHINLDHDEDNDLLKTYANAAKITIENYLNRKLYNASVPDSDSNGIVVNDAIKVAVLMLVSHWYDNREAVTINGNVSALPLAYQMLINPYRIIPL
jgi:uncharacterized phage protein (predicted DNA packaging)